MSVISSKRYWITGASSGLGRALVEKLVQQGHQLIASSRNYKALQALALDYPEQIRVLPCDVSDSQSMQSLFAKQAPELDYLDGIILGAGLCEYIDLPDFNLLSFERHMAVNFHGTVNSCAAAYPLLKQAKDRTGSKPFIAGLCSMSSYLGFPRAEAYGASKAAMAYFLDSLRADIGQEVDIITVYLGFVETPMTAQNDFPMPFIQKVDVAANAVLKNIEKRPYRINFPLRLHIVLKFFSRLQGLWYSGIMPRLRRTGDPAS
jgi:NAD(P)-dependent dehydrogenase (short-subunit alcohol dehydrogenase family)